MTRLAQIRAFNRFYTQKIGLLDRLVPTTLALTEARLLYEIGTADAPRARALSAALGLDEGYVSRLLTRLESAGLVARKATAADARAKALTLTVKGRAAYDDLVDRADDAVAQMISAHDDATLGLLLEAMSTIEGILGSPAADEAVLREMDTGDLGWLIKRYGELCAEDGFDLSFEALVARIIGDVFEDGRSASGTGWVAVRRGARLGGIVYTREDDLTGRLRTLIVEPSARGMGIGRRLVDQVIAHARADGMHRLVLWTEEGLGAAVRLYERTGFRLTGTTTEHAFGRVMRNQTWELDLTGGDLPHPS